MSAWRTTAQILATGLCIATLMPAVTVAQASGDCGAMMHEMDPATMDHAAHQAMMAKCAQGALPTSSGQAAYGAIAEVVRILEADPHTDWSKVNVEALRQHLIDMDDVTLHAKVAQRSVDGGVAMDVTGEGRTADAIRRMLASHASMLDQSAQYSARANEIEGGVRFVVTAKNPADVRLVSKIRGLGFAGLLTEGDHHAAHHLALARGNDMPHEHR
jgi:hypothetical protein